MSAEIKWNQVVIATVFIIAFYSFANCKYKKSGKKVQQTSFLLE